MSFPLKPLHSSLVLDGASYGVGRALRSVAAPDAGERRRRFEGWFRDHFDTLWRLAARLGVPHGNVDDVVQEAFITAERRAEDIVAGSERNFLISATVKLCANQRRREKTILEHAADVRQAHDQPGPADGEQMLAHKQLRQLLDMALDELPLEQRTVLVLHQIEGFSAAEIAELLDLPAGTVASRLGRARTKFSKAAARLRAHWPDYR
jgi:RNA polymerase sigma-70 factor (ECF subfamily)